MGGDASALAHSGAGRADVKRGREMSQEHLHGRLAVAQATATGHVLYHNQRSPLVFLRIPIHCVLKRLYQNRSGVDLKEGTMC